jgi:Tfp pilus assembly protein PilX
MPTATGWLFVLLNVVVITVILASVIYSVVLQRRIASDVQRIASNLETGGSRHP